MDGKVPETMHLRNKKAPKVLNSGTPEVSNQLVRTERCAHAEIVLSSMSRILLQTSEILPKFSTISVCFNLPRLA